MQRRVPRPRRHALKTSRCPERPRPSLARTTFWRTKPSRVRATPSHPKSARTRATLWRTGAVGALAAMVVLIGSSAAGAAPTYPTSGTTAASSGGAPGGGSNGASSGSGGSGGTGATIPTGTGAAGSSDVAGTGSLAGYDVTTDAIGLKFSFDIPYLFPLSGNLLSDAVPLAQSTAGSGPVIDALAAPYYPGQILGHLGTDLVTFGAPSSASALNDPLLAESKYPPAPGAGASDSFGGTPPKGYPIAPDIFSATTDATTTGAQATATLSDLGANPSSQDGTLASPETTPTPTAQAGARQASPALHGAGGTSTPPTLHVATTQVSNTVALSATSVRATATSVVRSVDIAGILKIAQVTGTATSTSNGTAATPSSSLRIGEVTVDGVPAYIDSSGVHVDGHSPPVDGVTPAQAQQALEQTFSQDGLSVHLLEPTTTTSGGAASAGTGGLVVAESHAFDVPVIPGAPSVPIPGLGSESLPAGTYDAVTTITLGDATAGVQASVAPPLGASGFLPGLLQSSGVGGASSSSSASSGIGSGFGAGSGFGTTNGPEAISTAPAFGPGTRAPGSNGASGSGLTASLGPLGLPVPLGWAVAAVLSSLLGAYGLLLAARWQFLGRRRH